VTGLTGHVDLRPCRCVAVGCCVVALAHVGRVAVRAHVVPVLLPAGPRGVGAEKDSLTPGERKTSLAARLSRARVPDTTESARPRRSRALAGGRPAARRGIAAAASRRTCTLSRSRPACRRARPCGP